MQSVLIQGSKVELAGYVGSANEKNKLISDLKRISLDGKISEVEAMLPGRADKTAFRVSFTADRNIQKSRD
jgi:hypothetical protein